MGGRSVNPKSEADSTASDELAFRGGFRPLASRRWLPGFPPGIHPGQIVIPQAADLSHEFRRQAQVASAWLPGENASR